MNILIGNKGIGVVGKGIYFLLCYDSMLYSSGPKEIDKEQYIYMPK